MATKKTGKIKTNAPRATSEGAESTVREVRLISEDALKRAIRNCNTILERNSESAGEIGQFVRTASEQGMDPVAFRMLLRLVRKGERDGFKLGSILRSFDHGRRLIDLDSMVPPDMFLDAQQQAAEQLAEASAQQEIEDSIRAAADQAEVEEREGATLN